MHQYEQFRSAVMQVLGDAPDHIEPGRIIRFATDTRRTKKSGWCIAFDDDVVGGVFGDFRTGVKADWWQRTATRPNHAEVQKRRQRVQFAIEQAQRVRQQDWADARQRNAKMWNAAHPVDPDDPVGIYLRRRGLVIDRFPDAVRFHPRVGYYENGNLIDYFPAMLGLVTNDGTAVGIHRTYLTSDGRKAPVGQAKKLTMTSGSMSGACIQLGAAQQLDSSLRQLGVAEGIETALAAMLASGIPTVAAISAGGMERYALPPLGVVDELTIFADNDTSGVGQAAAAALEKRAIARGLAVRKLIPTDAGTDWADGWAAAGAVHG
jgi:putative DNA primase/helicase